MSEATSALIGIANMASIVMQKRDWHKLTNAERNLVDRLEEAGYLEKKATQMDLSVKQYNLV